jgi:hypothetical protein
MHCLNHTDLVRASSPSQAGEARAGRMHRTIRPPQRSRLRRRAARVLAGAAQRLDRESARRAVA